MKKYSFNGHILPPPPGGYTYSVIMYQSSSKQYYLVYTQSGFIDINGTTAFLASDSYSVYTCLAVSSSWVKTGLNIEAGSATFVGLDKTSNLVWSSHHVIDAVNSTTDNQIIAFSGSTPAEVVGADQAAADFGWNDGSGISIVSSVTLVQGWSVAGKFACLAVAPDGGDLTVQWYKNGSLFQTATGNTVSVSEYKPSADNIETYTLQVQIYNTFNGNTTGGVSHVITVNVVADTTGGGGDSGGDGTGGGGGTGDGGYIPTTSPETPLLILDGEDKTYSVGDTADPISCTASVSDGGTLTYAWYDQNGVVGTGNTYTPPTDQPGENYYYCVATNTLNGYSAKGRSDHIYITVLAPEEQGFCKTSFSIGFADGVEMVEGKRGED